MAQVNVTINGRVYRMACEDGQEEHLQGLAAKLDETIGTLRQSFGEIGDQRLTVMAAIMAMDELSETSRRLHGIEAENRSLKDAGSAVLAHKEKLDAELGRRLDEAARRIEGLAAALTRGPAA